MPPFDRRFSGQKGGSGGFSASDGFLQTDYSSTPVKVISGQNRIPLPPSRRG